MAKRSTKKATGSPRANKRNRQTAADAIAQPSPSQTHSSGPVNAHEGTSTHTDTRTHASTHAHGIGEHIDPSALRGALYAKAHRKGSHVQDDNPPPIGPVGQPKRGKRGNYDRLTYKQEAFALAFVTSPSAVAAYRRAYNTTGMKDGAAYAEACKLLKIHKVAQRITQLKAEAAAKTTLSRAWVLENLMEHATVCLGKKKLRMSRASKDGDVHEVEVTAHDASAANRALELLGKEAGMFIDRRETGGPGDFARMADTELLDYIRQQQAELEGRTVNLMAIEIPSPEKDSEAA